MRSKADVTLDDALRETPVRTGVVAVLPVVLGIVQLCNSFVTDLPVIVGICFAGTMVTAAVVFTRHHLAQLRLEALETHSRVGSE